MHSAPVGPAGPGSYARGQRLAVPSMTATAEVPINGLNASNGAGWHLQRSDGPRPVKAREWETR